MPSPLPQEENPKLFGTAQIYFFARKLHRESVSISSVWRNHCHGELFFHFWSVIPTRKKWNQDKEGFSAQNPLISNIFLFFCAKKCLCTIRSNPGFLFFLLGIGTVGIGRERVFISPTSLPRTVTTISNLQIWLHGLLLLSLDSA